MPPRQAAALINVFDQSITVGKVPNGDRIVIGIQCAGQVLFMSPKAARRIAKDFRGPRAVVNGLGWVADALEECASEVKAMSKADHAAMLAQARAMIEAHGASKQ